MSVINKIKNRIYAKKAETFDDRTIGVVDEWLVENVRDIEAHILFAKFDGFTDLDALAFMYRYRDAYRCAIMEEDLRNLSILIDESDKIIDDLNYRIISLDEEVRGVSNGR